MTLQVLDRQVGLARENGRLSREEEQELARRWRISEDQAALSRLMSTHLGLVVRIAMRYRESGVSMDDLIQEGNVGLILAAKRFDPKRGVRLATYATYWIRAMMLEHIVRTHGQVSIGSSQRQRRIFYRLSRIRRQLEQEGMEVDRAALARELEVREDEIAAVEGRLSGKDRSLDAPRGLDDSRSYGDLLGDNHSLEDLTVQAHEDAWQRRELRKGLQVLDPRERAIIARRYLCARPQTLLRLSERLGISKERVRQLELRAKDKLKRFVQSRRRQRARAR